MPISRSQPLFSDDCGSVLLPRRGPRCTSWPASLLGLQHFFLVSSLASQLSELSWGELVISEPVFSSKDGSQETVLSLLGNVKRAGSPASRVHLLLAEFPWGSLQRLD